jgi:hypothetical protein
VTVYCFLRAGWSPLTAQRVSVSRKLLKVDLQRYVTCWG